MWKRFYLESSYMQLWKWKYFVSIMNDSVITCGAIIDVKETNLNEKHITCKT